MTKFRKYIPPISCFPYLLFLFSILLLPLKIHAFPADFDGDGKQDPTVYRPSTGYWYVAPSGGICPTGFTIAATFAPNYYGCQKQWGLTGDVPISGDFDADGKADPTVYRPSNHTWYISYSSLATSGGWATVLWPPPGTFPPETATRPDIPDEGDVNADGRSDIIMFRQDSEGISVVAFPRIWTTAGIQEHQEGSFVIGGVIPGPIAASGAWNPGGFYAGTDPTSLLRFQQGMGLVSFSFLGRPNLPYAYNNGSWGTGLIASMYLYDGKSAFGNFWPTDPYGYLDDPTIFNSSSAIWYTHKNTGANTAFYPTETFTLSWGSAGDEPIPGKFFERTNPMSNYATWRPSDGVWYVRKHNSWDICPPNYQDMTPLQGCKRQWGLSSDIPVK